MNCPKCGKPESEAPKAKYKYNGVVKNRNVCQRCFSLQTNGHKKEVKTHVPIASTAEYVNVNCIFCNQRHNLYRCTEPHVVNRGKMVLRCDPKKYTLTGACAITE